MTLLIKNADLDGVTADVLVDDKVQQIGGARPAAATIDARGCAVIPGLHDHHIHLYAAAAARSSIDCAGFGSINPKALSAALHAVPGPGWVRGVNYHESIAGDLDAVALDRLCASRPVRLQHSSGKLWILNTAALQALDLASVWNQPGLERDGQSKPTGRLWRMDAWLHTRLPSAAPANLSSLSKQMASFGITSVTDASYTNDRQRLTDYGRARQRRELLQHVQVMGDLSLPAGQLKILLDEDDLLPFSDLVDRIKQAHDLNRGVAFHAVSHVELLYALSALLEAGRHSDDRIEHAGVVRAQTLPMLRAAGVTVVTQPGFIADRGARFYAAADPADQPCLYPYASLLAAGVPVAASSDAPYGPLNPWLIMAAAATRVAENGEVINPTERVSPQEGLRGYLASAGQPGGPARQVRVGARADLLVLDRPLAAVFSDIAATQVRYTLIGGEIVYTAT